MAEAQLLLASRVAAMHYLDNLGDAEIASRLGISRFRVQRLVQRAREAGLVEITVRSPVEVDGELSAAVAQKFGLAEVLVFPERSTDTIGDVAAVGVGRLAAQYLADIVPEGGSFGVTWGHALEEVAKALPAGFPKSDVIQLAGGLSDSGATSAMDVLSRFAAASHGHLWPLNSPLFVSDARVARGLRHEPAIARTLAQVVSLDAAIVGIGSWNPPSSQMIRTCSEADIAEAIEDGALADIAAIIVDADGNEVTAGLAPRFLRADSADFRRIRHRIGVVTGIRKTEAVRAVLSGGWITVLATDAALAADLLADAG